MTDTLPTFKRNKETGLIEGREYPRTADNRIDWRAQLNPAHVVFNTKNDKVAAEIEKLYGGTAKSLVYADVVKEQPVDDKHILVLLAGWQELAETRGYESSVVTHLAVDSGIVVAAHSITWIPNVEDPLGKTTSGTADATMDNTGGWGYLGAMAGNRAFARAVKLGLGIRIYGFDEIGKKDELPQEAGVTSGSSSVSQPGQPVPTLIRTCQEFKFSFAAVKQSAITKYANETAALAKNPDYKRTIESDPATWNDFADVPPRDCATLIARIRAVNAPATVMKK